MRVSQTALLLGLSSLATGVLFGVGLTLADMTNPNKVLNFLDVTGHWDASLLLVLGAAVVSAAAAFRWILRRPAPLLDARFHLPVQRAIDARLVSGAAIFGMGWGVAGYCPGPALASLGFANPETLWFIPALIVGMGLQRRVDAAGHGKQVVAPSALDI